MWLIADYLATTLFSLKPAWATSSGGRTLLLPTPYAIKMALLDVVCRVEGVAQAAAIWPWLRDRPVALRPARQVVVNNTFTRILKPSRGSPKPGAAHAGPYQKSIGYREYAYLDGTLGVALWLDDPDKAGDISGWLAGINYLGKRGGFMQLTAPPQLFDALPDGFIPVNGALPEQIPIPSIVQQLDECDESLTFEKANIYSPARVTLNKERVLHSIVLPYRVAASSRAYTWYTSLEEEGAV